MPDKDLCSTCTYNISPDGLMNSAAMALASGCPAMRREVSNIKNTKQIISCITEALAAGRPAFMTDGTVTRKVIQVELTDSDLAHGRESTLDVRIEDGSWKQIPVSWPWDELTGYGLTELGDGMYIAPDWWIAL